MVEKSRAGIIHPIGIQPAALLSDPNQAETVVHEADNNDWHLILCQEDEVVLHRQHPAIADQGNHRAPRTVLRAARVCVHEDQGFGHSMESDPSGERQWRFGGLTPLVSACPIWDDVRARSSLLVPSEPESSRAALATWNAWRLALSVQRSPTLKAYMGNEHSRRDATMSRVAIGRIVPG
jgi:hypothetical protein